MQMDLLLFFDPKVVIIVADKLSIVGEVSETTAKSNKESIVIENLNASKTVKESDLPTDDKILTFKIEKLMKKLSKFNIIYGTGNKEYYQNLLFQEVKNMRELFAKSEDKSVPINIGYQYDSISFLFTLPNVVHEPAEFLQGGNKPNEKARFTIQINDNNIKKLCWLDSELAELFITLTKDYKPTKK